MSQVSICHAHAPICPNCRNPIRRAHTNRGDVYLMCHNPAGSRGSARCGQHLHVLGMGAGLCAVTPLSRDQFEQFTKHGSSPREVYEQLNVVQATVR